MRDPIKLKMPEGGAERELIYERHHRCPQAKALVRELGDDIDNLYFPVGLYGQGMPGQTPFLCTALEECRACGRLLTTWFVWDTSRLFLP